MLLLLHHHSVIKVQTFSFNSTGLTNILHELHAFLFFQRLKTYLTNRIIVIILHIRIVFNTK